MTDSLVAPIPKEVLAEQWFGFMHSLINELQQTFRSCDFTQKDIAARLDIDPATVSRCLSGQQNMTIRTIHDLARAMDHRPCVILEPLHGLKQTNRPATPKKPLAGITVYSTGDDQITTSGGSVSFVDLSKEMINA